jgi:hypothetical protein
MRSHCPICNRHDYDSRTLKEHLLLCHRERPVLANAILDLLDLVTELRAAVGPSSAHNVLGCVLCLREVLRGSR